MTLYRTPARTLPAAAAFLRRAGLALLMPHAGIPLPSLFEVIRGRPGGHPFRPWTKDSDRMWEWKDAIPAKRLAFYGAVWRGVPGYIAPAGLPAMLRIRRCPPGPEGFREAYRDGRLPFDANRIAETLLKTGALNVYRLRIATGLTPGPFKSALTRLERALLVARCGTDDRDTTWPATVVDLTARLFPQAFKEAAHLSPVAARAEAEERLAGLAPGLPPRKVAVLLGG